MDVVFLTPVEVEYRTLRSQFHHLELVNKQGYLYEKTSFVGEKNAYSIVMRQTGSKIENISLATEKAIQHFEPAIIILLGMCGGVKDVEIGDVVVGTQAYGYESTKETDEGSVIRPDVLPYTAWLVDWARYIASTKSWHKRIQSDEAPKVSFAPIASGNKVIASTKSPVFELLKRNYNDTGALEMEAIGFAKAMQKYPRIAAINIRGVSDLLDNKAKSDKMGSQEMATKHAAAFALEMLYQLDFKKQTMAVHDTGKIAEELMQLVFPKLLTAIGVTQVMHVENSSIVESAWEQFNDILEEEKAELAKNPTDLPLRKEAMEAIKYGIRRKLKTDPGLLQEFIQRLQEKGQREATSNQKISNSKFVIQDSQISAGGNVRIGDEHIGQQINNNGAIKNQVNIADNKGDLNFD